MKCLTGVDITKKLGPVTTSPGTVKRAILKYILFNCVGSRKKRPNPNNGLWAERFYSFKVIETCAVEKRKTTGPMLEIAIQHFVPRRFWPTKLNQVSILPGPCNEQSYYQSRFADHLCLLPV